MRLEKSESETGSPKFVRTPKDKTPRAAARLAATKAKATSDSLAPLDFDELVRGAGVYVKDIFVGDVDSELLSISDWIKMPALEEIIGKPGIPCGLITMAYGKKDCGKTTFATEALVSAQQDSGIAILLDTEHKYDIRRAEAMGLKKPIIIRANTIEEAFDKFIAMIHYLKEAGEYHVEKDFKTKGQDFAQGEVIEEDIYKTLSVAHKKNVRRVYKYADRKICCVWDSLGATPSEAELDDNTKDFSMTAAKVIKGRIRKVLHYIKDSKVAFIIINQVYSNMNMFGKKITPYGGSGPEYHSALILEFAQLGRIRPPGVKASDGSFCGIRTQIECVKNHMAQPFKKMEMQIDHKGFVVGRDPEYAPEIITPEEEVTDDTDTSAEVSVPAKKRAKRKAK